MAFNVMTFLIDRIVIENAGVPSDEATRLALLPSFVDMGLGTSVLLSTIIGRNAAPPPTGTVSVPPDQTIRLVSVPNLTGDTPAKAKPRLTKLGLEYAEASLVSEKLNVVVGQDPAPDSIVEKGSTVTVYIGAPAGTTGGGSTGTPGDQGTTVTPTGTSGAK